MDPRPPEPSPPPSRAQRTATLVGTLVATFLAALDQTVVTTAGPAIQQALDVSPAQYAWMTTSYLVAATVFVPIFGRLADVWGRKQVLLSGVGLFLAASVLCGAAPSAWWLIAFRVGQGAGAAAIFPTAFTIVADLFPAAERGRYSGLLGAVFGVASLAGPLLGGLVTDTLDWRWVFFLNAPLGAVSLALVAFTLPKAPPVAGARVPLDVPGALLLVVGVVPLLLALSLGRSVPRPGDGGFAWGSAPIVSAFALAALGVVAFVGWEWRAPSPLVDLRLFRDRVVGFGTAAAFTLGAVFLVPMVFLPLFMVHVVHVTNTASGLTITPLILGTVAGNVLSGQAVSALGRYRPLMFGTLGLLAAGLAVMGFTLTPDATQAGVTLKMVVLGLGLGPSVPLYTLAIQNAVERQHVGAVTSMATFFRQLGATVGVAVAGSLFATTLFDRVETLLPVALASLPPELAERFSKPGGGAGWAPSLEGGADAQGFDAQKAKARALDQLEGARVLAHKALAGDVIATHLVEGSPFADARLKEAAAAGGVAALWKERFEDAQRALTHAADVDQGWDRFCAESHLPAAVLAKLPPPPVQARYSALAQTQWVMEAQLALSSQEQPTVEADLADATRAVDLAIDAAGPKLVATVDAVDLALRRAFTDAMTRLYRASVAWALLALAFTLLVPHRPLRTSLGELPPALE